MNVSDLIKPLIIGKHGIDDDAWKIKISIASDKYDNNCRIEYQNKFKIITKQRRVKKSIFNVILHIRKDGKVLFNRITLGKGNVNHNQHRMQMKAELYELFKDLRELNCTI